MDKEMSAVLMADFSAEQVGHKPVVWCKQCTEANRQSRGSTCANHKIVKCLKCRTKVTDGHNCLDFVGHADARARLCQADPEWTWEPFEFPGTGALIVDSGSPVGLWIKLTIGGVSKPGYGSVDRGKAEAMKELIGDALRNAALSFGVAWKLWAKGDRTEGQESAGAAQGAPQSAGDAFENATPAPRRQPNGNGHANGNVTRPPAREQAPAATGEPDEDAQPYADEAHDARTTDALGDINTRARNAHKLAALIRSPVTGGTGGLGQFINWKRGVLQKAEKSLEMLRKAGEQAGMDDAELDREIKELTGHGIEDATAEDMDKAAKSIADALMAGAGRGAS